jgi:hypothetical protein
MRCSVTEVKVIRYSNTAELTEYYRSVFMKLTPATQQEILKELERPKFRNSGVMSTKPWGKGEIILLMTEQATDSDPEEEVPSVLVASLRRERLTFFRRALEKVGVLGDLEPMLSVRRDEEEYEKGRLGLSSNKLAAQTVTNSDIRFKQLFLTHDVSLITTATETPRKQRE